jgi:UDP-N-acetylenolpyruvoylglucosamine reductase
MTFPDIVPQLKAQMPELRGRLLANQPLSTVSWFRTGGPAQAFYMPADEADLSYFLKNLPADLPVTVIGASSNLILNCFWFRSPRVGWISARSNSSTESSSSSAITAAQCCSFRPSLRK